MCELRDVRQLPAVVAHNSDLEVRCGIANQPLLRGEPVRDEMGMQLDEDVMPRKPEENVGGQEVVLGPLDVDDEERALRREHR